MSLHLVIDNTRNRPPRVALKKNPKRRGRTPGAYTRTPTMRELTTCYNAILALNGPVVGHWRRYHNFSSRERAFQLIGELRLAVGVRQAIRDALGDIGNH